MKRILALLLSLSLVLSLAACQQQAPQSPSESASGAAASAPNAAASAETSSGAEGEASTDPADGASSTDPADLSQLLESGLGADASASVSAPPPTEEPEGDVQRGARTFGLSMPQHPTRFQEAVAKALQHRVEKMGDSLIVAKEADNGEAQAARLNELANQKVEAIFLCPVDAGTLEDALTALAQQELPVFGFGDWDFTPEGVVSIIHSDDYNAGYVCGMDLAERCPKGGDVLVLEYTASNALMERAQGFMDAVEESGVDLEIADELETEGQEENTAKLVKEALTDDVVGIFAASDTDAAGALTAVGDKECWVYGGDGSPELKAKLGKSRLAGLGAQFTKGIAKALEENANQYLDGEAVDEEFTVGTYLITEKNVEKYGTEDWQ